MSELFPEGISSLYDMPHTLFHSIGRTLVQLSWDELPEKERPPKRIWKDDEALVAHFERVKREREREFGSSSGQKPIEDPVDNEAAAGLRG